SPRSPLRSRLPLLHRIAGSIAVPYRDSITEPTLEARTSRSYRRNCQQTSGPHDDRGACRNAMVRGNNWNRSAALQCAPRHFIARGREQRARDRDSGALLQRGTGGSGPIRNRFSSGRSRRLRKVIAAKRSRPANTTLIRNSLYDRGTQIQITEWKRRQASER